MKTIFIIMLIFFSGCMKKPTENYIEYANKSATKIKVHNEVIKTKAVDIASSTKEPGTKLKANDIINSSDSISSNLTSLEGNMEDIQGKMNNLSDKNKELTEQNNSWLHKKIKQAMSAAILAIVFGIAFFIFSKNIYGLYASATGFITLIILFIIQKYLFLLVITGICVLLGTIGYICYKLYKKELTIKDLVNSIEVSKQYIVDEGKDVVLKEGGLFDKIQNKYTKDKVKELKND